ncbi:hypothetical protein IQ250_24020 [Pseudanabaenaceae cyanobacterium LEGE 13415]|nr:hypothetical protein [Pseudanabaenaceae cyanobacterium LEGE 13415]
MANLKRFAAISTALVLSGCTALNTVAQTPAPKPAKNNLIGLFIVKRDNLKQQYRAEIFPIARYSNGRYTDASVDVTTQVRENSREAEIIKRNAANSILNTKPTLNAINPQGGSLGKFSVDRLEVGRFACSAVLVGRGKFTGQSDIQATFNQLPKSSETRSSGAISGREFDETWRSTIATQLTPTAFPTAFGITRPLYEQARKDLLQIGTSEIAKIPEAKSVPGSVQLIDVQVFDLDRDGKPEVYGRLRKAPSTPVKPPIDRPVVTSIYANVWLGYATPQAKVLSTQVVPYYVPSDASKAYEVLGTIDANGDGKQEVLIQNNGYEAITFSIHELQGNQLKPVFTGAGYGC